MTPSPAASPAKGLAALPQMTPIDLSPGTLQIQDLAPWLEKQIEIPVAVDPNVASKYVIIVASMREVDLEVLKELLEAFGCTIERSASETGREELRIRSTADVEE